MSFSRHVLKASLMKCNYCCKSYIYNKYGLYMVKGENKILILNLGYSLNVDLPSYDRFPFGNRKGNDANLKVISLLLTFNPSF